MVDESGLPIEELETRTGMPARTIRFYIAEGLLPGPGTRGKGALYGDDHLQRLLLIRQLTEQRLPLAEVRRRLIDLSPSDVRDLLQEQQALSMELRLADQRPSPKEYIGALLAQARQGTRSIPAPVKPVPTSQDSATQESAWTRWELAPGLELHIRSDMERHYRDLLMRLIEAVRQRQQ